MRSSARRGDFGKTEPFGRSSLLAIAGSAALMLAAPVAKADEFGVLPAWNANPTFEWHSPFDLRNWKFGFYQGVFADRRFGQLLYSPFLAPLRPEAILAANAVYKIASFPWVPLDAELDLVTALHTGAEPAFGEAAMVMGLRWKWFPWNNFAYTNFRFGTGGPSYTTRQSSFERLGTANYHSARLLNFMYAEWTLSPDANSPAEFFARIHHRSGANGRINHVTGGSNYLSVGLRTRLD